LNQRFWTINGFTTNSLVFVALLAIAMPAVSATSDEPPQRVWSGTIGTDAVRVCFKEIESSFYRLKDRRGIGLESKQKPGDSKAWQVREGYSHFGDPNDPTPMWQLDLADNNTLTGLRTDANRKKPAERIRLKRVLDNNKMFQNYQCGSAFYAPLVQATAIKTKEATFLGKPYLLISSQYGRSFQLPDSYPNAPIINAVNRMSLDAQVAASYECDLGVHGKSGWFTSEAPFVWTDEWLVARSQQDNIYCGGAHGDAYSSESVFDLRSGKQIDTWHWIKGGERAANPLQNSTALRKLLHKYGTKVRVNKAFGGGALDLDTYVGKPFPTYKGLVFPTRLGACRGLECDVYITVPYGVIATHLTPDGTLVAADFTRQPVTTGETTVPSEIDAQLLHR
jgi:hypothetical protein